MRVLVIVDAEKPQERRTCFWPQMETRLTGVTFECRSLADSREKKKFLDFNEFECLVFNWDVLNTEYWFRGEVTAGMIDRASRNFLPGWVKKGGLLVFEAQCRHWIPSQRAYEVALKNPGFTVWRYDYYKHTPGTCFAVTRRYRRHPFLWKLDSTIEHGFHGQTRDITQWFPDWLKHECTKHNYIPTRTHSGVFLSWEPMWLPLLVCGHTGYPVMLARTYGKGAIVATTMYLASSGQADLIAGLLQPRGQSWQDSAAQVLAYHRRRIWWHYPARWSVRMAPTAATATAAFYLYNTFLVLIGGLGFAWVFAVAALSAHIRAKIKSAFQIARASLASKGPGG